MALKPFIKNNSDGIKLFFAKLNRLLSFPSNPIIAYFLITFRSPNSNELSLKKTNFSLILSVSDVTLLDFEIKFIAQGVLVEYKLSIDLGSFLDEDYKQNHVSVPLQRQKLRASY